MMMAASTLATLGTVGLIIAAVAGPAKAAKRYTMAVPAGSSMSFTSADSSRFDIPVIGLLDQTIEFDCRY